jgi:hypothetical protein
MTLNVMWAFLTDLHGANALPEELDAGFEARIQGTFGV